MSTLALSFQRSKLMTWWWVVFFLMISNEYNKIYNIRIKFLHLVLSNICRFEAILCAKFYKLRVYFDALSQGKIFGSTFFFTSTMVEIASIWASDIQFRHYMLRVSHSAESLRVCCELNRFANGSRTKHW